MGLMADSSALAALEAENARLIARRGVSTLVLVHRTELLKQWQERLQAFVGVGKGVVGTIGGGKTKTRVTRRCSGCGTSASAAIGRWDTRWVLVSLRDLLAAHEMLVGQLRLAIPSVRDQGAPFPCGIIDAGCIRREDGWLAGEQ